MLRKITASFALHKNVPSDLNKLVLFTTMPLGGHTGCLHVLPVLFNGPPVSQAGKGRRRLRASIHHSTVLLLHGVAEGTCTFYSSSFTWGG